MTTIYRLKRYKLRLIVVRKYLFVEASHVIGLHRIAYDHNHITGIILVNKFQKSKSFSCLP